MDVLQMLSWYPAPEAPLDPLAIRGKWYVIKTSLPFWRTRTNPTITYTLLDAAPVARLHDDVRFRKRNGMVRHIVGIDTQDAANSRVFHWRGNSWHLRWLTSDWCFLDHDPEYAEWAVTYFSKTAFTAAGIDLYSRTPSLDPALISQIEARLRRHQGLGQFVPRLFEPVVVSEE